MACSNIVSIVEPLLKRNQPSSSPNTNTWPIKKRLYCAWDSAQSSAVTIIATQASRGKVGDKIVKNVVAAVLPLGGQLLLGQSFLARFKSWSLDNTKRVLLLNPQ